MQFAMEERTFTIIKPNAVAMGVTGRIIDAFLQDGFRILAMRLVCMSRNDAEKFYAVHRGREFFSRLVDFMTSGPCVVMLLEREDAVAELRRLVGNTDPARAAEGTLRRMYGENVTRNAVHASDSVENARMEASRFSAKRISSWPDTSRRRSKRGRADGRKTGRRGQLVLSPPAGFCFPTDTVRLSALFCNLFYPCRDVGEHFGREGLLYLPVFRRQARSGVLEEVVEVRVHLDGEVCSRVDAFAQREFHD